jgi:hypothetical protein
MDHSSEWDGIGSILSPGGVSSVFDALISPQGAAHTFDGLFSPPGAASALNGLSSPPGAASLFDGFSSPPRAAILFDGQSSPPGAASAFDVLSSPIQYPSSGDPGNDTTLAELSSYVADRIEFRGRGSANPDRQGDVSISPRISIDSGKNILERLKNLRFYNDHALGIMLSELYSAYHSGNANPESNVHSDAVRYFLGNSTATSYPHECQILRNAILHELEVIAQGFDPVSPAQQPPNSRNAKRKRNAP